MKITKMEGCGNDFVLVEFSETKGLNLTELTKKLCDRHYGVGADGAIYIKRTPLEFVYYNADGSYSSFCGNGMRCFAKYCVMNKIVKDKKFDVLCDQWKICCEIQKENIRIYLPEEAIEYDATKDEIIKICGSRHKVIEVENLENEKEVRSESYNLNYVKVINDRNISIKTIEKGVGLTLACGSGSYASALKMRKNKKILNKIKVKNRGGTVEIDIKNRKLTGPAKVVFECEVNETALKREESAYKKGVKKKRKK